ncbi:hypothetical protein [Rouxiella sp. WC2420]|uniref:Uncharacterized protein n=1 Tax=Rouxiella sp. WC2420 TaxID=3234145 RepID=A0AB39VLM6_9GAMM
MLGGTLLIPIAGLFTYLGKKLFYQTRLAELTNNAVQPYSQNSGLSLPTAANNCLEIITKVRSWLNTDKTGWPLAGALWDTLFNQHGDLDFEHANTLLRLLNITDTDSKDRLKMNESIQLALSSIISLIGMQHSWNIDRLIYIIGVFTDAPLKSLSSQWLCFGAIIANQLGLSYATVEDLFKIAKSAFIDAGLIPVHLTAIRQIALLDDDRLPAQSQSIFATALKNLGLNIIQTSELQNTLFASLIADKRLAASLQQLMFMPSLGMQYENFHLMLSNAINEQSGLIALALRQLPQLNVDRLIAALRQGKLAVSLYHEINTLNQIKSVAGLALRTDITSHGLLLPLGNPQEIPVLFRQLPESPDNLTT